MNHPIMLKLKRASEIYGISYYRLRLWALNGTVAAVRAGRDILLNTASLEDYLNKNIVEQERK